MAGAGDVNGDGLADVVVSAPYANVGVGEAYVVYGKTSGTLLTLGGFSSEGFTIRGPPEEALDLSATGVGDVNGDGLADVGLATASGIYVVYGTNAPAEVDLAALLPAQGFAVRGANESQLDDGKVSGAGDVNGDGYDDIVLSAPLRRSVAVVFGRPGRGDLSLEALTALDGFVITIGAMYQDQSVGFSVSGGGDLNGDGLSDLFITNYNQEGGELRGSPVASAGDANGDGLDDWIIGSLDANSMNDAYILYGWDMSQNLGARATALQRARGGEPLGFAGRPLVSATGSLPSNAGRAVLGRTGAFYGLEISSTDMTGAP